MTRRDINLWSIHCGISISPDEAEDIVRDANGDIAEGVEWMPFYKAALGQLSQLVGLMAEVIEGDVPTIEVEDARRMERIWRLHLLLGGIGPQTDLGKIASRKIDVEADDCFSGIVKIAFGGRCPTR